MAEERDEQFFLEISDNPDYILFAEDLVSYVMFRFSPNYTVERYPILYREHINLLFDDIIQRAIHFLIKSLEARNRENFHQMWENLEVSPDSYRILVSRLERDDIGRKFSARYFLIYCANVSTMAAFFYNSGIYIAPQLARAHIISVLDRKIPADQWNSVRRAAELILYFSDANEIPKRSDSHQSELLNQTQAYGEELNSSRERQNVLTENKDRNLELQLEDTYSKREAFLKISDGCSLQGTSDIRYSPLKELKLSEDESMPFNFEGYKCIKKSEFYRFPRSDTSNIDNVSSLIKIDHKRELDLPRNETNNDDSQTMDFVGKKHTQISSIDSKFCIYQSPGLLDGNNSKRDLVLDFEAKDMDLETPSFEDKLNDRSSKDRFYRDLSNTI